MKTKSIFFILAGSLLLASCSLKQISSSKTEDKLAGRWDILSISSSAKPDSVLIKDFNNMLHTLLINAVIEFTPDHKFNAQIAGKLYEGNWELDPKSQTFTLTEKTRQVRYSYRLVNESEIDMSAKNGNQEYFVKLQRPVHNDQPKR